MPMPSRRYVCQPNRVVNALKYTRIHAACKASQYSMVMCQDSTARVNSGVVFPTPPYPRWWLLQLIVSLCIHISMHSCRYICQPSQLVNFLEITHIHVYILHADQANAPWSWPGLNGQGELEYGFPAPHLRNNGYCLSCCYVYTLAWLHVGCAAVAC